MGNAALLPLSFLVLSMLSSGQTTPAAQPLTLWGITMGQAPPVWATCPATPTVEAQRQAGPCVQPEPKRYSWDLPAKPSPYTFVTVQNLPFASGALDVTLYEKRVDEIKALVPEMLCSEVHDGLEKKLGKPGTHTTTPVQNSFGATWNTDAWTWTFDDGTQVTLWQHLEIRNCNIEATTSANRQRNKPAQVVQP